MTNIHYLATERVYGLYLYVYRFRYAEIAVPTVDLALFLANLLTFAQYFDEIFALSLDVSSVLVIFVRPTPKPSDSLSFILNTV